MQRMKGTQVGRGMCKSLFMYYRFIWAKIMYCCILSLVYIRCIYDNKRIGKHNPHNLRRKAMDIAPLCYCIIDSSEYVCTLFSLSLSRMDMPRLYNTHIFTWMYIEAPTDMLWIAVNRERENTRRKISTRLPRDTSILLCKRKRRREKRAKRNPSGDKQRTVR